MESHVPLGFRFSPSDVEIVDYYLQTFMSGKPAPAPTINEFDIYTVAPWDLPGKFIHGERGSEEFFLTPRHKHGSYRKRTVGQHGTWYGSNPDTKIIGTNAVAFKVSLAFKRNGVQGGKPTNTDWLMHEYRFKDSDLALCRIFNKNKRIDDDDVELTPDTDLPSSTDFTVPPGFKFAPTDKEILFYLKRMVAGIQVPTIFKLDVYAKEPWDLPGSFKQGYRMNEQLFFTQRIAKFNGRTIAGNSGCWRSSHKHKIRSGQRLLGHRTYLNFKRKEKGKMITTEWLMYEYRLGSDGAEFQDSSICKVYRNRRLRIAGAVETIDRDLAIELTPLRELPFDDVAASSSLVQRPPTKRHRIEYGTPPHQLHHKDFMDASSVSAVGTQSQKHGIVEVTYSTHHQDSVKAFSVDVECVQEFASLIENEQVEEAAPPTPKEDVMEVTSLMEPAQIKKGQIGEPRQLAQSGSQSTAPHLAYQERAKPNWVNEKIIRSWLDGNLFVDESNFAESLEYLVFSLTQFVEPA